MEQKNEIEFLMLKNYSNFLVDLGLNFHFSQINNLKISLGKIDKKPKTVQDLDNYIREMCVTKDFEYILRNKNTSSKNILLLSEENRCINFYQSKNIHTELLEKMFASIGQNLDDFFIINIDLAKTKKSELEKINEILKLYFSILKPKIFIDMCSSELNKFFETNKLNLNFDYFNIPSLSDIIKNQNLKRHAWEKLKLLKVKLNEF